MLRIKPPDFLDRDNQVPDNAKAVNHVSDVVGDIEAVLDELIGGDA